MSVQSIQHDPPPTPLQKERAQWLGVAVAAPPAAWVAQLLLLSAFTNYACYPGDTPVPAPVLPWLPGLVCAIDLGAAAIAAASVLIALRYLKDGRRATDGLTRMRLGRLHFVAMGGLLSGVGFLTAIGFEGVASLMVRACAS